MLGQIHDLAATHELLHIKRIDCTNLELQQEMMSDTALQINRCSHLTSALCLSNYRFAVLRYETFGCGMISWGR